MRSSWRICRHRWLHSHVGDQQMTTNGARPHRSNGLQWPAIHHAGRTGRLRQFHAAHRSSAAADRRLSVVAIGFDLPVNSAHPDGKAVGLLLSGVSRWARRPDHRVLPNGETAAGQGAVANFRQHAGLRRGTAIGKRPAMSGAAKFGTGHEARTARSGRARSRIERPHHRGTGQLDRGAAQIPCERQGADTEPDLADHLLTSAAKRMVG
ncbi:unnamed protein product [Acanthosepion pharaonis]|uniref:Uncharacterized protein n=1 Tax=Acanthosepion pharaonis TaxID=158019 RepID=A0A812DQC9_ACAPH|nr:unnamed protein product [Sepia pharaonis]